MTDYGLPAGEYSFYLGIDPGLKGAIGLIDAAGHGASVWDMPVKDHELDLAVLGTILSFPEGYFAGLEWPTPKPGDYGNVPAHAENLGRQKGVLEAMLYDRNVSYSRIVPHLWKGQLGLKGKDQDKGSKEAAAYWDATYPAMTHLIRGPRGGILDGRLDALLIAHFLRRRSTVAMRQAAKMTGGLEGLVKTFGARTGRRNRA